MVKKLASFLASRTELRSLARAILATLALVWVAGSSLSWFPLALFACVLGTLFVSQSRERVRLPVSFWMTAVLGIIGIGLIGVVPLQTLLFQWSVFGSFLVLQFALLSLPGLDVRWRTPVFVTVNSVLLFGVGVAFFILNQPAFLGVAFFAQLFPVGVFLGTALLVHEALVFLVHVRSLRTWAVAAVSGAIAVQTATLLLFLPLGVVNAAVVLALLLTLVRDILCAHFEGKLSPPLILRELLTFVVVLVVVFALSPWSI
jgi:hypothetical protein